MLKQLFLRNLILTNILLLLALPLLAQYSNDGTEAASTRWYISRSGAINLIYPADARPLAGRYLAALRAADSLAGADYGLLGSRIDVVLHNHSVLSNGSVAWCPRRMELIAQPHPADLDAQPWPEMLALHEMRHVKQMYALRTGVIRGASVLLGEQSVGLAAGLVPRWLLEGDAVLAETKLSASGRGRSASFYQHYRAHLLTGQRRYSFDKWSNGSYRHYIPNRYAIGYQLMDYVELKHGAKTVGEVMDYVGRRPFAVPPIYWALRRATGMGRAELCGAMLDHLDSLWREAPQDTATPAVHLSVPARGYTSYAHPHMLPDGRVLALRTSLRQTQAIVEVDTATGSERVLARPGYLLGRPHIGDSLIVWAEHRPHLRWEQVSYSRVVVLDRRNGCRRALPQRGRFSSPVALASGGVAAIGFSPDGQMSAIRLNSCGTIDTLCLFEALHQPTELSAHGDSLYALVSTLQGKRLMRVWPGAQQMLTPPVLADIGSIEASDSGLYFAASYRHAEHVFFYNIFSNNTIRVVTSRFGSRYAQPAPSGGIICSDYTPQGYAIGYVQKPGKEPFELSQLGADVTRHQPLLLLPDTAIAALEARRYNGLAHMVNVHSWMPLFVKPTELVEGNFNDVSLGFTALSQNLTGSTMLSAAYGYAAWSEQHHLFNATLQYQRWWPVVALSFDLEPQSTMRYNNGSAVATSAQQRSLSLNAYIPIRLSVGQTGIYIRSFSNISYNNSQFYSSERDEVREGRLMQSNGLYISVQQSMSLRDLYPRWGWTMQGQHTYSLSPWARMGSQVALSSTLYAPGLLCNHSVRVNVALQRQWANGFYMNSRVGLPRGYDSRLSEQLVGFKLNYAMPLMCPDLNIGSVLYIKRLSVNMFCDYARNYRPVATPGGVGLSSEELQSVGADLMVDFHAFRMGPPLRFVLTAAWPQGESIYYDFGFSFSFN